MRIKTYSTQRYIYSFIAVLCINVPTTCLAETEPHPTAIQTNNFANALVKLSDYLVKQQAVISKESLGGYGGLTNDLEFYKETKNINKTNNQVISIIRRENKKPDNLHDVVVNIYDDQGRIKRDYSASYLPVHRNAPYQTLINLYYYEGSLTGFRQFDALNNLLYEQCQGTFNNKPVNIAFDELEIPDSADDIKDKNLRQAYLACFKNAAATAEPYTNPLVEIK